MLQPNEERNLFQLLKLKHGIIGESPKLREVLEKVVQAAPTDLSVLITGETGTGKEVFANAIHGLSLRKKMPFLTVNCSAIPETLLESELFGHEKGAFTGAIEQRKGFFEVADKGTIFLDEIGEMPLGTQVKLLRVLESGDYIRLGSTDSRKTDVRIIAATNRDLEEEVRDGNFRQDLFFRLNAVHITIPPLREHISDIPLLVKHFAERVSGKLGLKYDGIAPDALNALEALPWQGNIRELKNMIETLVTLEQVTYITPEILKRYIPAALPESDYNSRKMYSLVPLPKIDKPVLELELIFRTLLELKRDINDIKEMLFGVQHDIDAVKADIIELHPETGHEVFDEETPQIDEYNLNLSEVEKRLIMFALHKYDNNRRKAAQSLGISERTLYRKLQEYGIE